MFACHGGQKILGVPPRADAALAANSTALVAGWIELPGGFLIAFGLVTRLAAFISSGEMAVAYFMNSFSGKVIGHAPTATERILPILNKGELPVCSVLCSSSLFLWPRTVVHRCLNQARYGATKGNCLTLQDQQRIRSTSTFL